MKKYGHITYIVFILIVLGGCFVVCTNRTVPFDQCSDLYRKYAPMDGVEATFIKDYQVNDTLFRDVTVLKATDSAGWNILKRDFNIPEALLLKLPYKSRHQDGEELPVAKQISKKDPSKQVMGNPAENDMAIYLLESRTITVFHTKTARDHRAIISHTYPEGQIEK